MVAGLVTEAGCIPQHAAVYILCELFVEPWIDGRVIPFCDHQRLPRDEIPDRRSDPRTVLGTASDCLYSQWRATLPIWAVIRMVVVNYLLETEKRVGIGKPPLNVIKDAQTHNYIRRRAGGSSKDDFSELEEVIRMTDMKKRVTLVFAVASGLIGFAAGLLANGASQNIVVPIEAAEFSAPLGPAEVSTVTVWGDPTTGPSSWLVRLKRGSVPGHPHRADHHIVVIKGSMLHAQGALPKIGAKPLAPGSYWYQVKDETHQEECLSDECLIFAHYTAKLTDAAPAADQSSLKH
jgi:hypothetical protein